MIQERAGFSYKLSTDKYNCCVSTWLTLEFPAVKLWICSGQWSKGGVHIPCVRMQTPMAVIFDICGFVCAVSIFHSPSLSCPHSTSLLWLDHQGACAMRIFFWWKLHVFFFLFFFSRTIISSSTTHLSSGSTNCGVANIQARSTDDLGELRCLRILRLVTRGVQRCPGPSLFTLSVQRCFTISFYVKCPEVFTVWDCCRSCIPSHNH